MTFDDLGSSFRYTVRQDRFGPKRRSEACKLQGNTAAGI